MRLLYWIAAVLPLASAAPTVPHEKTLTRGGHIEPRQLGNVLTLAKGNDPLSRFLRDNSGGSLGQRAVRPAEDDETQALKDETQTSKDETQTSKDESPTSKDESPASKGESPASNDELGLSPPGVPPPPKVPLGDLAKFFGSALGLTSKRDGVSKHEARSPQGALDNVKNLLSGSSIGLKSKRQNRGNKGGDSLNLPFFGPFIEANGDH